VLGNGHNEWESPYRARALLGPGNTQGTFMENMPQSTTLAERSTVAIRLTSMVPAAIAVIEVAGPRALEIVGEHWRPHVGSTSLEIHAIRYGTFRATAMTGGTALGTAVPGESIVVHRSAVDRVELHCHGGIMAADSILRTLECAGVMIATSADWIAREVREPIEAEAIEDLQRATTVRTARVLIDQQRGALRRSFEQIDALMKQAEWRAALTAIEELMHFGDLGGHLVRPWRVVLCGPPNVGKSSLLNRLLGYTRAIVHEQAGTTRDLLSESTSIDGWPVELIDSAGVRCATDAIESQGIARARSAIEQSDRVLLLVDPIQGWTDEHQAIWEQHAPRALIVQTKRDLSISPVWPNDFQVKPLAVSASTGEGIETLMARLSERLVPVVPRPGQAVPFRARHMETLEQWRIDCGSLTD
jgi:tRNA modification GTPase